MKKRNQKKELVSTEALGDKQELDKEEVKGALEIEVIREKSKLTKVETIEAIDQEQILTETEEEGKREIEVKPGSEALEEELFIKDAQAIGSNEAVEIEPETVGKGREEVLGLCKEEVDDLMGVFLNSSETKIQSVIKELKEVHDLNESEVNHLISGILEAGHNEADEKKFDLNSKIDKFASVGSQVIKVSHSIGEFFGNFVRTRNLKITNFFKSDRCQQIWKRLKALTKSWDRCIKMGQVILGVVSLVIVINLALSRPHIKGFNSSSVETAITGSNVSYERIIATREAFQEQNLIHFFETWIKSSKADLFIIDFGDGYGLIFDNPKMGKFQYNHVDLIEIENVIDNTLVTKTETVWSTNDPYAIGYIEKGLITYEGREIFQ